MCFKSCVYFCPIPKPVVSRATNPKENVHKLVPNDLWVQNDVQVAAHLVKTVPYAARYFYVPDSVAVRSQGKALLLTFLGRELKYPTLDTGLPLRHLLYQKVHWIRGLLTNVLQLQTRSEPIVYNGIHPQHIVIDSENNQVLLSNFSAAFVWTRPDIAIHLRTLFQAPTTQVRIPKEFWCMEMHLIDFWLSHHLPTLSIHHIEHQIRETVASWHLPSSDLAYDFILEAQRYYKPFVGQSFEKALPHLLTYAHTWDGVGIGLMAMKWLGEDHNNEMFADNIHPVPTHRRSIAEMQERFMDLDWKSVLHTQQQQQHVFTDDESDDIFGSSDDESDDLP